MPSSQPKVIQIGFSKRFMIELEPGQWAPILTTFLTTTPLFMLTEALIIIAIDLISSPIRMVSVRPPHGTGFSAL